MAAQRNAYLRRRRTKIVATLGPASNSAEMIRRLFVAGVDVFRLNFSHGEQADHAERIRLVRALEEETGRPIGLLADVQGPKLRVGRFTAGAVTLREGQDFRLDLSPTPGDSQRVQLPHPEIIAAARIGSTLLLDDGKLRLTVVHRRGDHLETRVVVGGRLSDRKGVNVPDVALPIPALTDKDRSDIAFAIGHGVEYIGLSFVQRVEDVHEARALAGDKAWILSKIEKPQALAELDAIVEASDAVMVARGDLGVELPPEEVPLAQRRIIRTARRFGRPVIVATQMLESMISAPTPTRAEASDVANAVFDGTDAVMLSAESAAGQYPVEAVAMMDRIVARTESDEEWREAIAIGRPAPDASSPGAIAVAAGQIAQTIGSKVIVAFTQTGSTGLRIARERPIAAVLCLTPLMETARRMTLVSGVHPVRIEQMHSMTETVATAARMARQTGLAARGEEVVVSAGVPFNTPGTTNALRVVRAGRATG